MKRANLHSCNVLEVGQDARQLWQFTVSGGQIKLSSEQSIPLPEPFPPKAAARSLFQRRLNIAWLPADQVFLRAVRLPVVEQKELVPMVEFQLEKLSPFPVNQIVWSIELLPGVTDGQQTVIVIIAARDVVEAFLGRLEADKYLPDRLELPQLHQLLTTPMDADGAWIYPTREASRILCLVAWWFGGVLQQVQMVYLPNSPQSALLLIEQLNKIAWAGEMEGWLTGPTRWHLVATPEFVAEWEPALNQWSSEPILVSAPPSRTALAELAARRAAQGESKANLLPAEYGVRYRQQFVDRLWMTGLGAVMGAYIAGVLIYFAVLFVMGWQKGRVVQQVKALSGSYTNALRLRERIDVLQNQRELKYAALDAFKVVAEYLPEDFTLHTFHLKNGRTLTIGGTAPVSGIGPLQKYVADIRQATVDGQLVFAKVDVPAWTVRSGSGGTQTGNWGPVTWELKRVGTEP